MGQIFSMMGFGRHECSGTPKERAAVLEQHAKTSTDPEAVSAKDAYADARGDGSPMQRDEMGDGSSEDLAGEQGLVDDDEDNAAPSPLMLGSRGRAGYNPATPRAPQHPQVGLKNSGILCWRLAPADQHHTPLHTSGVRGAAASGPESAAALRPRTTAVGSPPTSSWWALETPSGG